MFVDEILDVGSTKNDIRVKFILCSRKNLWMNFKKNIKPTWTNEHTLPETNSSHVKMALFGAISAYFQVYTLVVRFREGNNFVRQLTSMVETFNAKSRSELIVMRGAPLWGKGGILSNSMETSNQSVTVWVKMVKFLMVKMGRPKVLEMINMTYTLGIGAQKWRFGRCFSFSIGWFWGSILIFGRAYTWSIPYPVSK